MARELPEFSASSYSSRTLAPFDVVRDASAGMAAYDRRPNPMGQDLLSHQLLQGLQAHKIVKENVVTRRVVKVYVADTNENIPLDKCLLYQGPEQLTDLSDQELFYELDIKQILEKHNVERIKYHDKKIKDRIEYLEPARVRDLRMTVVTVASF